MGHALLRLHQCHLGPVSQGPRAGRRRDRSSGTTRKQILVFAGLLVAISLIKGVFLYAQRWILIGISREIEFDLRNDLFRKLEQQDSGFYQRYRTGDIMARMTNDLNAVRMLLGPALMYSANTIFFTVFALFFLLRISPWLTLVALAPMPLASILVQYFGSRFTTASSASRPASPRSPRRPRKTTPAPASSAPSPAKSRRSASSSSSTASTSRRALRLVQLMGMLWPTLEFILGISMIITLLAGGHLVIAHRITVGQFVAFNTYMILLIWPIIAVGWVVNIFQRGTASVKRIDELLKAEPAIDDGAADSAIPADTVLKRRDRIPPSELQLRRRSGPPRHLAAHSRRLEPGHRRPHRLRQIHAGQPDFAASMKRPKARCSSTAARCATIRWPCCAATSAWSPRRLFSSAKPSAKTWPLARPTPAAEELLEAAEAAHIRQEFEEFPQGFETMVGERGVTLSGGQKQRAAIARALLRRPAILILDDALASVDTYTEERILGGLRSYTATSTTILISHRVSTVRNADQIAVLDHGRIVELGRTTSCSPSTATTPASTRSSNWKKNSPSPDEAQRRESGAPCYPAAHSAADTDALLMRSNLKSPCAPSRSPLMPNSLKAAPATRSLPPAAGPDYFRIPRHLAPGIAHILARSRWRARTSAARPTARPAESARRSMRKTR